MKMLHVPVPETVTAGYLIPLETRLTVAEARRRVITAVGTQVTGPLQTLLLNWIRKGAVILQVTAAPDELLRDEPSSVRTEQLTRLAGGLAFVRVTATGAASPIAVHEWKARGAAAALAASIDAPLVDTSAWEVLNAQEALAALPETTLLDTPSDDVRIGFSLQPWVRFRSFADQGKHLAVTEGMYRFGLPEFSVGGCERDLQEELKEILLSVTFRVWSDLVRGLRATPNARDLLSMPRSVRIPAELDIHRRDLDQARGVPNRGGTSTTIGLRFHPAPHGQNWLIVCPPSEWDMGWEDFVANVCHAMFAFEKPSWYYLPQLGAILEALQSLPEARRRLNDGELPARSQLMVRYNMPDDSGFRWARVESWTDADRAIVRDSGPELAPAIRAGHAIPIETRRIFDWAIWANGRGIIEGAMTECVGYGF